MQSGERVSALIAIRDGSTAPYLVMATRQGFVKKTPLSEYGNVRRAGLIAIELRKDDQLAWVAGAGDKDRIVLATRKGKAVTFKATDARPMGRQTQGITAMRLSKGHEIIGMGGVNARAQALPRRETSYAKRTKAEARATHNRPGPGPTPA